MDDEIGALLEQSRYRGGPVGWTDIVGHDAAKRELRIVAEQLRRHSAAQRLGLTLVKGVVIFGPPGTGKSQLAKALATEVDRPVYVLPSAELEASTIRHIYDRLASEPSVVVIDEADVAILSRWAGRAQAKLAAALCSALDGVQPVAGPVTVALTTQSEHALDPSVLRAGRLTTKISVDLPTAAERRLLWDRYLAQVPVEGEIDLDRATDRSLGFSGADISATVMIALGLGMVEGADAVTAALLDEAILRGNHVEEREPEEAPDLWQRSVHEAGHAAFAALRFGVDRVRTVTIYPSGPIAGRTLLADELRHDTAVDRRTLRELVALAYAGMAAEELVLGVDSVTAGAQDDLRRGTDMLRRLVGEFGADEGFGPVSASVLEHGGSSDRGPDEMREALWQAVRAGAREALDTARSALRPAVPTIVTLAQAVSGAEAHTISGDDLEHLLLPLIDCRDSTAEQPA